MRATFPFPLFPLPLTPYLYPLFCSRNQGHIQPMPDESILFLRSNCWSSRPDISGRKRLFALVAFEVPTLLAHRSLPLADIATAIKLHPIAADRFLNACVALNLFGTSRWRIQEHRAIRAFPCEGQADLSRRPM